MIQLVLIGIYVLGLISGLLFLSLLIKIIYDKIVAKRKMKLKLAAKRKVNNYLNDPDNNLIEELSEQKIKVMEEVIVDYLQQVKGETADELKDLAEASGVVDFKVQQIKGSNPWWKKSEAAYALGNLGATSASDALLDTLES
ncbi:MAG: hypothetical protein ACQERJ_05490, partial [Bacillota bacterium]